MPHNIRRTLSASLLAILAALALGCNNDEIKLPFGVKIKNPIKSSARSGPSSPTSTRAVCHVLFFGDTEDLLIGKSVERDLSALKKLFQKNVTPASLKVTSLTGKKLTVQGMMDTIRKASPDSSDTLVVYYSGHGAYDKQHGHMLQASPEAAKFSDRFVTRKAVKKAMKGTGARLNVLISDCCSNQIKLKEPPKMASAFKPSPGMIKTSREFKSLFFAPAGFVDMSAATPGQVAIGDEMDGGYFTVCLSDYLEANTRREVTWPELYQDVRQATSKRFKKRNPKGVSYRVSGKKTTQRDQTPFGEFDLRKDPDPVTPTPTPVAPTPTPTPVTPTPVTPTPVTPGTGGDSKPLVIATGPRFGVRAKETGGRLVITQVVPNSPATRVRVLGVPGSRSLQRNDIILEINGKPLSTEREYASAVDRSPQVMTLKVINSIDKQLYNIEVLLAR